MDRDVALLGPPTRALLRLAVAMDAAPASTIEALMRDAAAAGTNHGWIEELMLSAVLFVGYPRALVAASARRAVLPQRDNLGDAIDYAKSPDWESRGIAIGNRIYGANFDKLRAALMALHPALGTWIVTEGYGRAVARPGLDIVRRELCAIALLVPQDAPRQLHSHLLGAQNVGASQTDIDDVMQLAEETGFVSEQRMQAARALWATVRVH